MLETDDIDDDYFTPVPSTSLANIFTKKNPTGHAENTDNESLKYTPPKPKQSTPPTVESKVTDCLLACVLFAYEWAGDNYVAKGKIGFAIMRNNKNNNHDIILYDSNKRTLSCASVTSHLEVTVKGGYYISYYDNIKKLWSLYATEEEVRKISDLLKSLSVEVKNCEHSIEGLSNPNETDIEQNIIQKQGLENKESDTDSSINTKTKISILNRLASMGQSVLPRKNIISDITSDSSDNETTHFKTFKHKSTKGIIKKIDKPQHESELHTSTESVIQTLLPQTSTAPLLTVVNGQLVPLDNNSVTIRTNDGNDINTIMNEQRICNSELRINMGRLTDRMDQMLYKIKSFENSNNSSNTLCNAEVDLYKKLISEYEYKIKTYEDMLFKGTHNFTKRKDERQNPEQAAYESTTEIKNKEIDLLRKELFDKTYQNEKLSSINTELTEELANLKKNLAFKENELINISPSIIESSSNVEEKLKSVMNETFRTISTHFESDVTYSGTTIKSVIAAIIKKVTLNSFQE